MGRNWELRIEAIGELCSFIYGSSNELPRYEEAAPFEIYISTLAVEDPEARISLVYEILSGTPYYFDFLRSATGESWNEEGSDKSISGGAYWLDLILSFDSFL